MRTRWQKLHFALLAKNGVERAFTATELLAKLNNVVDEEIRRSRFWPAKVNALGNAVERAAPAITAEGYFRLQAAHGRPSCDRADDGLNDQFDRLERSDHCRCGIVNDKIIVVSM